MTRPSAEQIEAAFEAYRDAPRFGVKSAIEAALTAALALPPSLAQISAAKAEALSDQLEALGYQFIFNVIARATRPVGGTGVGISVSDFMDAFRAAERASATATQEGRRKKPHEMTDEELFAEDVRSKQREGNDWEGGGSPMESFYERWSDVADEIRRRGWAVPSDGASPGASPEVPGSLANREALADAKIDAHPVLGKTCGNAPETLGSLQQRVQPWMMACFGPEISADRVERNHRFLEEALELVQSTGCTQSEAHQLVDYVYGRPVGETHQEVGGVMITLAALCLAIGEDMHAAGETELARIWTKVEKIRAKQAAKPKHSPLPEPTPPADQAQADALRAYAGALYNENARLREENAALRDPAPEAKDARIRELEAEVERLEADKERGHKYRDKLIVRATTAEAALATVRSENNALWELAHSVRDWREAWPLSRSIDQHELDLRLAETKARDVIGWATRKSLAATEPAGNGEARDG